MQYVAIAATSRSARLSRASSSCDATSRTPRGICSVTERLRTTSAICDRLSMGPFPFELWPVAWAPSQLAMAPRPLLVSARARAVIALCAHPLRLAALARD